MAANLSKTAALREAQGACGKPIRRSSTDYVCYVPYDRIDGPSTELQANSYPSIVAHRARKVARLALVLMGAIKTEEDDIDAECAMEAACEWGNGSAAASCLVEAAVESLGKR
jgi:hypothetical protein